MSPFQTVTAGVAETLLAIRGTAMKNQGNHDYFKMRVAYTEFGSDGSFTNIVDFFNSKYDYPYSVINSATDAFPTIDDPAAALTASGHTQRRTDAFLSTIIPNITTIIMALVKQSSKFERTLTINELTEPV